MSFPDAREVRSHATDPKEIMLRGEIETISQQAHEIAQQFMIHAGIEEKKGALQLSIRAYNEKLELKWLEEYQRLQAGEYGWGHLFIDNGRIIRLVGKTQKSQEDLDYTAKNSIEHGERGYVSIGDFAGLTSRVIANFFGNWSVIEVPVTDTNSPQETYQNLFDRSKKSGLTYYSFFPRDRKPVIRNGALFACRIKKNNKHSYTERYVFCVDRQFIVFEVYVEEPPHDDSDYETSGRLLGISMHPQSPGDYQQSNLTEISEELLIEARKVVRTNIEALRYYMFARSEHAVLKEIISLLGDNPEIVLAKAQKGEIGYTPGVLVVENV